VKKVIAITGAGKNLGKAFAIGLSKAGYTVVASGTNQKELDEVARRLSGEYLVQVCDITDFDDCKKLIDTTVKKFGRIDVLINNAGVYDGSSFVDVDAKKLQVILNVVVRGTANISKAALEKMIKQKKGHIISLIGDVVSGADPSYNAQSPHSVDIAAKRAKYQLTNSIRREASHYGVNVSSFLIKWVASNIDIESEEKAPTGATHPKDAVEYMHRLIENPETEIKLPASG
jgi:short-subunit dehydrogenase